MIDAVRGIGDRFKFRKSMGIKKMKKTALHYRILSGIFFIAFCGMFCGCRNQVKIIPQVFQDRLKLIRYHSMKRANEASVGSPIVKTRVTTEKIGQHSMSPNIGFAFFHPPINANYTTFKSFPIAGKMKLYDEDVFCIPTQSGNVHYLVGADGKPSRYFLWDGYLLAGARFIPEDLRFVISKRPVDADCASSYCQISEFVYTGIDKDRVYFTYREYNIVESRPVVETAVVYPRNVKTVKFRDIIIDIDEVNEERIVYTVKSDGFKSSQGGDLKQTREILSNTPETHVQSDKEKVLR